MRYNHRDMKRAKAVRTLVVAVMIAAAAGLLRAQAVRAKDVPARVRVSAEQANIREKPDIGSAMIAQVPGGTVLKVRQRDGDWYLVLYPRDDGTEAPGYIHASLVVPAEPAGSEAERAPGPVKTVPPKTDVPREAKPETPPPARPALPGAERPSGRTVAEPSSSGGSGYAITFAGGGNYALGGDLNKGLQGLSDYYADVLQSVPATNVSPLHLSYVFGAEALLPVVPDLFVAIGIDYFHGRNSSLVDFGGEGTDTLQATPTLSALPVKASLVYYPVAGVYLKGGLGYYFVRCGYDYRLDSGSSWREWEGRASSQGLGAEAAVGGEWEVYPRAFLFVEGLLRYARVGGFQGTTTVLGTGQATYTEQGSLWIYTAKGNGSAEYPLLFIRERAPSEAGVMSTADAKVDFSGAALRLGIRIRF